MANLSHHIDEELPVCITVKGETLTLSPDTLSVSVKDRHRAHWFLAGEGTIDAIEFDQGRHPFHDGHIECVPHVANAEQQKRTCHTGSVHVAASSLAPHGTASFGLAPSGNP